METTYEWDVETVDNKYGDIMDHAFDTTLKKVKDFMDKNPVVDGHEYRIVLVRNVGDDIDGLVDREWAYMNDGKLPEYFDGGSKVPKRFHKEVDKNIS